LSGACLLFALCECVSRDNQDLIAVSRVFTSCKARQGSVDFSSGGRDAPLSVLLSHYQKVIRDSKSAIRALG